MSNSNYGSISTSQRFSRGEGGGEWGGGQNLGEACVRAACGPGKGPLTSSDLVLIQTNPTIL